MDLVEIGTLTTYEIATDGAGARLHFVDVTGHARTVYVPVEMLKFLTLSVPKIMLEVLRAQFHDSTLRLVHAVDSWRVERASDGKMCILTFTTPDHFSISFNVNDRDLNQLSEAVEDYELEAFPQGLQHFH
jgi:hypothetical protein